MARKKKAETKTETSKEETNVSKDFDKSSMEDEKFSISELLEKNNIKALNAVGFLNYFGLSEDFKEEFETGIAKIKFFESEFNDMYKRYIEREI